MIRFSVCALFLVVAVGCGDGLPQRVPVAGKVLIDGQPLTRGTIRMMPVEGGRQSTGQIADDGSFVITTFKPGDGCVLGKHVVTIQAFEDIGETSRRWFAPRDYSAPAHSGLTADIDGPTDSLEFQLTWNGVKGPVVERIE